MKSLEELNAIRDRVKKDVILRKESTAGTRVVVGLATCGIAAGARPVLNAFSEEVAKQGLSDHIMVTQAGCAGLCPYEPVVEVFTPDGEKTTYVKMTSEKAVRVVTDHLIGGKPVEEYTLGSARNLK